MKTKFNIIDGIIALIIILVIIAGCFIYFNFSNKNDDTSVQTNMAKINFTVEVNNLTEVAANSFKNAENCTVTFGETASGSGVITKVEVEPFKKWVENKEDGEILISEVPNRWTVKVTIESDVEKTAASFTSGSEVISVGKAMPFNSFGVGSEDCYIVDLSEVK